MNILVIEDDLDIAYIMKRYLEREHYQVDCVHDGEAAKTYIGTMKYDLIILDLMLPKFTGEELLQLIRKKSTVPVIIVSAKTSEKSKLQNLIQGADDYITKPFSMKELVVRVKTILRRISEYNPLNSINGYYDNVLTVDFERREVSVNQEAVILTKNEFNVLKYLIENTGIALTREQCLDALGNQVEIYDRNIDTYIKQIRSKIKDNQFQHKYITSVYAIGYKFNKRVHSYEDK